MENKINKIYKCRQYLIDTDYIIIKLYEAAIQGNSINEMLDEYKETLIKREEARNLINELEEIGDENGN